MINENELNQNEYLNEEDGLKYCTKCNTPKECEIDFLGKKKKVPICCSCKREQIEKEEEKRENDRKESRTMELREKGSVEIVLQNYTFENSAGYNEKTIDKAKRYVQNWEHFRHRHVGLLLWGDIGSGKTYIAGCIANALIQQGVPVLMTNFVKLLNGLWSAEDKNQFVADLNRFDLIIIDDLGFARDTPYVMEQVFNIVDSLYRAGKPMIITTNLTIKEIKQEQNMDKNRIFTRILERCVPINVCGTNIRLENYKSNVVEAHRILGCEETE